MHLILGLGETDNGTVFLVRIRVLLFIKSWTNFRVKIHFKGVWIELLAGCYLPSFLHARCCWLQSESFFPAQNTSRIIYQTEQPVGWDFNVSAVLQLPRRLFEVNSFQCSVDEESGLFNISDDPELTSCILMSQRVTHPSLSDNPAAIFLARFDQILELSIFVLFFFHLPRLPVPPALGTLC